MHRWKFTKNTDVVLEVFLLSLIHLSVYHLSTYFYHLYMERERENNILISSVVSIYSDYMLFACHVVVVLKIKINKNKKTATQANPQPWMTMTSLLQPLPPPLPHIRILPLWVVWYIFSRQTIKRNTKISYSLYLELCFYFFLCLLNKSSVDSVLAQLKAVSPKQPQCPNFLFRIHKSWP